MAVKKLVIEYKREKPLTVVERLLICQHLAMAYDCEITILPFNHEVENAKEK